MNSLFRALKVSPSDQLTSLHTALSLFGIRGWSIALLGALFTAFLIGIPAALIENPIFDRQIAARPQDYAVWGISAALGGLIIGTFTLTRASAGQGRAAAGGMLSVVAVGCPVCNQVAVLLLGTSGALNLFGPTQLYIGVASLVLLFWTLLVRAQSALSCPVETTASNAHGR